MGVFCFNSWHTRCGIITLMTQEGNPEVRFTEYYSVKPGSDYRSGVKNGNNRDYTLAM